MLRDRFVDFLNDHPVIKYIFFGLIIFVCFYMGVLQIPKFLIHFLPHREIEGSLTEFNGGRSVSISYTYMVKGKIYHDRQSFMFTSLFAFNPQEKNFKILVLESDHSRSVLKGKWFFIVDSIISIGTGILLIVVLVNEKKWSAKKREDEEDEAC